MKTRLIMRAMALTIASLCISCAAATPPTLSPLPSQAAAARISAELLTRYHYNAQPLNAAMSAKIFDHYLNALDPERMVFTQADIDAMSVSRAKLAAAILNQDLVIPFSMFNLYTERMSQRLISARAMVTSGFDFSQKESFQIERKDLAWPKTDAEVADLWHKRVKNDWLRLKLAGDSDSKIIETLDKRYASALTEVTRTKSDDAFEVFMNAYAMAVDPHTSYMGPRSAENFDIAMSLSLVGIGASMRKVDGYDTISELSHGSPASRSGQLAVGDRILGVAQSEKAPFTPIKGLSLDDTVSLIRGPVDSVVVLDILPAKVPLDGPHRRVSLVRKKIELDDEAAKKSLLTVNDGKVSHHIGVVTLPSFYRDFDAQQRGDASIKSASNDVAHLLTELKAEGAEGIVIDLRDNGGGSLTEAVRLTGLFTGKGPVLQERHSDGNLIVDSNTDVGAAWTGPVGVLINRNSASASEIFAAAIQDYGRGIVIGERSFGKGTVQSTVSLDALVKNAPAQLGELKMTTAQFFRIDGGTTQLRGVIPDIDFSTAVYDLPWGEAKFDNALPSFKVKPAQFIQQQAIKQVTPELAEHSAGRIAVNPDFQVLKRQAIISSEKQKANLVSLNEAERRKERNSHLASSSPAAPGGNHAGPGETDARTKVLGLAADDGLDPDERIDPAGAAMKAKTKDVVLDEAAHVVSDEVALLATNASGVIKAASPTARTATPKAGQGAPAAGF